MLKLNSIVDKKKLSQENLNTSYVKAKQAQLSHNLLILAYLNTSHVKAKLYLFIWLMLLL